VPNLVQIHSNDVGTDLGHWRTPITCYLHDPSAKVDKKFLAECAFNFILHNCEQYQRTIEELLLKCLDSDQAKVAMREVH
jgi:hypothetical protein